jgi:hypothetical protein
LHAAVAAGGGAGSLGDAAPFGVGLLYPAPFCPVI